MKNKFVVHIFVVIILILNSCDSKQKSAFNTLDKHDFAKDILVLSDDSLQGRAPLTLGEERAVAYLEKRMKEIGLEPAFDGKYTQDVPIVELTSIIPDLVNISTPNGQVQLKSGSDYTAICPVLKENISIKSSEIIFAGFGINAPEKDWNDFKGIDVKGKTILVLVNDPDFYSGDTSLFKGKAMTYQGRWRYKFEEAERQGATACFVIHEDEAAGYPWSVPSLRTNKSDFFVDSPKIENPTCIVTGWITKSAAIQLFASCKMDYETMKQKSALKGFQAVKMNAQYSAEIKNSWKKSVSKNVAGYIKGTDRADETLVYAAHWDHLGIGKKLDGDSIYNGASDNAAAISWMLAIAEAFKTGEKPKRSVLFFSPTAEEAGLLGSTYFVDHSPVSISKTIACINTDVVLFLGKFKDVTVTGLGHSELDNYVAEEAKKQGRYVCADPNPENGMFFRSDQLPFLKAGVPAIFAKGYTDQVELGKEKTLQKISEYWRTIYHKPTDTFDPKTQNLDGLREDAKLMYNVGFRLANEKSFPKWNEKSEFFVKR